MRVCTVTTFGPKSCFVFRNVSESSSSCSDYEYSEEVIKENSIRRSLRLFERVALSNRFDFFVTLTVSPKCPCDRSDYVSVKAYLTSVLNAFGKRFPCKYLLCPDLHQDGSVHFHGFFQLDKEYLRRAGNFRIFKQGARAPKFYSPFLNKKLGRNEFRPLLRCFGRSSVSYALKYVRKASEQLYGLGVASYVRSRGLLEYNSKEVFRGDDADLMRDCALRYGMPYELGDYGMVLFYMEEKQYKSVFRLFYAMLACDSAFVALPKRSVSRSEQLSFIGSPPMLSAV